MTNDELRPADWYPDPAPQPGQKYWDGQACQSTAQPSPPAVDKRNTWKKRLGTAAAVVLTLALGAEAGDSSVATWGGGTDPEDGTDDQAGAGLVSGPQL